MIEVLQAGLLTTVQDLGRDGWTHLGVSPAGACDSLALRIGNLLLGNPENTAALELTLVGGAFRFETRVHAALTGASFEGAPAEWASFPVHPGDIVHLGRARSGARGYLCVAGGIEVPQALGSASTHQSSGLGGQAVRRGDRLAIAAALAAPEYRRVPEQYSSLTVRRREIRITAGAHLDRFDAVTVFRFTSSRFRVQPDSNRQGLRISAEPLSYPGEILSEGVALGSIQVLPNGGAVILFVDSQTTGGYPVIAAVISADLPSVGQLRPGDEVRFVPVTHADALTALREQEHMMAALRLELTGS
jgi:antagonist of KipI